MGGLLNQNFWVAEKMVQLFVPDEQRQRYTDLYDELVEHPHRTWRETQISLLNTVHAPWFWTRYIDNQPYQIVWGSLNNSLAEWPDEDQIPILEQDKSNVVHMLALQEGYFLTHSNLRQNGLTLPFPDFDEPERWPQNLRLVLNVVTTQQRQQALSEAIRIQRLKGDCHHFPRPSEL